MRFEPCDGKAINPSTGLIDHAARERQQIIRSTALDDLGKTLVIASELSAKLGTIALRCAAAERTLQGSPGMPYLPWEWREWMRRQLSTIRQIARESLSP